MESRILRTIKALRRFERDGDLMVLDMIRYLDEFESDLRARGFKNTWHYTMRFWSNTLFVECERKSNLGGRDDRQMKAQKIVMMVSEQVCRILMPENGMKAYETLPVATSRDAARRHLVLQDAEKASEVMKIPVSKEVFDAFLQAVVWVALESFENGPWSTS